MVLHFGKGISKVAAFEERIKLIRVMVDDLLLA